MKQYDTVAIKDGDYVVLAAEKEEISENNSFTIKDRKLLKEDGCHVRYTGGIVIGKMEASGQEYFRKEDFLNKEDVSEEESIYPYCFQYEQVLELILENGYVTALIDHSNAMRKVEKNLEYGLRSLKKRRDVFVIQKFLKKAFVRKYPKTWVKWTK